METFMLDYPGSEEADLAGNPVVNINRKRKAARFWKHRYPATDQSFCCSEAHTAGCTDLVY
jgi:hypothetical protein